MVAELRRNVCILNKINALIIKLTLDLWIAFMLKFDAIVSSLPNYRSCVI